MPYLIAKDVGSFVAHFKSARKAGPVLVEFFVEGCHYCADMIPVFKRLGALPNVTVLTIDHDTHEAALKKAGFKQKVEGYPFMLAYPANGGEETEIDGAVDLAALKAALELP